MGPPMPGGRPPPCPWREGVAAGLDVPAGPEAEAVDGGTSREVALAGVGTDGARCHVEQSCGFLVVEEVVGVGRAGQRGNGLSVEVGMRLGLVVDEYAAVEERGDTLPEGGCVTALPGSERDTGLLGDVPLVDHGAFAGDHGVSLGLSVADVPCTLVALPCVGVIPVAEMLVRGRWCAGPLVSGSPSALSPCAASSAGLLAGCGAVRLRRPGRRDRLRDSKR